MKTWLGLVVSFVAISQVSATELNVTIFYETLCSDCMDLFKTQVWPVFKDANIRKKVHIELVPYGKANYTKDPFAITCQHGPRECLGNVLNACFLEKNQDNYKQVAFVSCCMSANDPPSAGARCAKKLGYSYKGVEKCATDTEGNSLQIKNGDRTLKFEHKITFIPTIVYNNKYDEQDQEDSLKDFKGVIARKLKPKGLSIEE